MCNMEMESEEIIGVEYRIFADGDMDHLLYKYDGTTDIVRPSLSPAVRVRV